MSRSSNSGIVHGPEALTLPAVQRYAIAHHERERAQEQAARAQRVMEYEEADARRALVRAGIPARQRIAVRLLGGAVITLFWDEAGLVVID